MSTSFWKPGSVRPGSSLDRSSEASSPLITSSSSANNLPIHSSRLAILHALSSNPILILSAPTGSGKTTQLPLILHTAGYPSIIACTQPRRLTAISSASRVSSLLSSSLGSTVGYTIRFETNTCADTSIVYMTPGTLLRECIRDPLLTRYSVVMVDEAHERGVESDVLLGVLKKVVRKRRELRVVVSSATMEVEGFRDFFEEDGVTVLQIEGGKKFDVQVAYLKEPCEDYVQETVETIWRIHMNEPQGDILAFLTGRDEIDSALQQLSDRQLDLPASAARLHLLPLHSGLSIEDQTAIFAPPPSRAMRKVVVATNIAEASITLDGIVYVVDCGLVKTRNKGAVVDDVRVEAISRASAIQRAGRAGRTRPGKCFRLYTEQVFCKEMRASSVPEMQRTDLSSTILLLKSLGIDNLVKFAWVPPAPTASNLASALEKLHTLGAIDPHTRLTTPGVWMSELPLPPHLARILLSSANQPFQCCSEILSIISMLSVTSAFFAPESAETQLSKRSFSAQEGDFLTLLNVFLAFTRNGRSRKWCSSHRLNFAVLSRAVSIRGQLERYLQRFASSAEGSHLHPQSSALRTPDAVERIHKCLLTGLYPNLARYNPSSLSYTLQPSNQLVHVHPTSTLFNRQPPHGKRWIVFAEATQAREEKVYIRDLCVLDDLDWLTSAVPGVYKVETRLDGMTGKGSIVQTSGEGG
ncbi:putative Pre-mRNA-splicing factor ATP-dependent RNA helicase PRP43 (putative) [Pseudozyma hubeiensis]|nr:putative Pre-mRNA-splicing factor ATP-dependent RNA helicase PRP43 (putative) [Pseudozyma hubeiensis]